MFASQTRAARMECQMLRGLRKGAAPPARKLATPGELTPALQSALTCGERCPTGCRPRDRRRPRFGHDRTATRPCWATAEPYGDLAETSAHLGPDGASKWLRLIRRETAAGRDRDHCGTRWWPGPLTVPQWSGETHLQAPDRPRRDPRWTNALESARCSADPGSLATAEGGDRGGKDPRHVRVRR